MGSIPYSDTNGTGITFRVWAPNATSVAVRGDFNAWGQTALFSEGNGNWSRDIPSAQIGQQYQYFINGSLWRRDPRSRRVTNSNGNSVIYDPWAFNWGDVQTPMPLRNDAVLYQMHPGTYNAEAWVPSTFDTNIERLDHIRNLGVNVIQLMPVNEFAADKSWGYNPSDVLAIESALGGPDALKRFVKAAHERGIAVFADVVHNHYGPSDLSLWQFDGWSQNGLGGIYFYNDVRAYTWWGDTRPDFGRTQVRDFIRDQIFMFVDEYRFGGFRWDSVFNIIYYDDFGIKHNPQGEHMLRDINWELSQTRGHVFRISEDHAFDFNMNFESMWDVGFHNHLKWQVTQINDADRNMNTLRDNLLANANHSRVVFSEAHDYVGDLNNNVRLPVAIDGGNPFSIWARKRQLLAASMVMTKPGIPMIFQGQEMNENTTFSAEVALNWSHTNTHAGIVRAYRDLITARRSLRGGLEGLKGTGINVHHVNNADKVIGFIRWNLGGNTDDVLVVANFGATPRIGYNMQFPSDGNWYSHFNSDAQAYGADFGNVGTPMVSVSGGNALIDLGMYGVQIFSKTPPAQAGIVTFDPTAPDGCGDVTIFYQPNNGPLEGSPTVSAMIGRNGWLEITNVPMTWNGSAWEATHNAPLGTFQLNMVFHDGAQQTFDNNFGLDWNLGIANCANLPALVTISPAVPQGCNPVTITYDERDGVLAGATELNLYLGRNGWQDIQTLAMTNIGSGLWQYTVETPASTWQLNFVFNNGDDTWDNNNFNDWNVNIIGCVQTATAGLSITNPVSDISVTNTVTQFTVLGSSASMVGHLTWTNTLTRQSGLIPVATNWSIPNIALSNGANLIRVKGTNSSVNLNLLVRDSATNTSYTTPNTWTNGHTGGTGFTEGWILSTDGAVAGFYLASTNDANNNIGNRAWGLWANEDSTANAVRRFPAVLHVGDVFTMKFDNNWIANDKGVGIGMQNRFGQNLFEFYFIGGGTNYYIQDADGQHPTGIPWSDQGHDLSFELLSADTYRFTVGAIEFTGPLIPTAETAVKQLRVWNFSAGGGWEFNLYVNDLAIDGVELESIEFTSERTITRGTQPETPSTPDIMNILGTSVWTIQLPSSTPGRIYDVYYATNLVTSAWMPMGLIQTGNGSALNFILTNHADKLFYTTGSQPQ
ncbi:MAG TPA: carbohydrate-binding protein [Kiritimatiellia bacterium]|nr:carbohydrate-binding protein [Kiritimatiellia bacterium]